MLYRPIIRFSPAITIIAPKPNKKENPISLYMINNPIINYIGKNTKSDN